MPWLHQHIATETYWSRRTGRRIDTHWYLAGRKYAVSGGGRASLPPTKEEVYIFASACLSVCLLARLLKKACMDLDEMLRVDRCRDMDELINF